MHQFLVDHRLLRLARWLRAGGVDATCVEVPTSLDELLRLATGQGRILLTCRHTAGARGSHLELAGTEPLEQLAEVFARFGSPDPDRFLTRCTLCNQLLVTCDFEQVRARLPEKVRSWCTQIWSCPGCSRLYWRGTHAESMTAKLHLAIQLAAEFRSSRLRKVRSMPLHGLDEVCAGVTRKDWDEFDAFLREIFSTYHFSWRGFRRKRRKLYTRFTRRLGELQMRSLREYAIYLLNHPQEQRHLHEMLAITVSRFFRDREEWMRLRGEFQSWVGAAGDSAVPGCIRAWSVACAGGEEPYTLNLLWKMWCEEHEVQRGLEILATDVLPACLQRAHRAIYPEVALHSVPPEIRSRFFRSRKDGTCELLRAMRTGVEFRLLDLLSDDWPLRSRRDLHLILCRNFAFTYLDEPRRTGFGRRLVARLRPGGLLMVGSNDRLGSGVGFDGAVLGLRHIGGSLWRLEDETDEPGHHERGDRAP